MHKTLILTSTVPGSGGVGDIYINNIVSGLDKSNFVRVSLVKKQNEEFEPFWNGIKSKVISIEKSHYPAVSSYYFAKFKKIQLNKIADELLLFIQSQCIEKIWVTLSSPELIILVKEISLRLKVKIYSTIWDVPEYLVQNNHLDPFTRKLVMNAFHRVLENSERISVIDEGMKNYLPLKIQVKSIIIRNGVNFPCVDFLINKSKDTNRIKIVFAGSIYAKKEWNAFVKSLISCNFTINGKQVDLICIGRLPRFGIIKDHRIKFMPFMPNEAVLRILAECDIGYVPYWFSRQKRLIVSTSFPGKISSYISSELKVFFHGPIYSTVNTLFQKVTVGLCCNSLKESYIANCLSELDYFEISTAHLDEAKFEFGLEKMNIQFRNFIS